LARAAALGGARGIRTNGIQEVAVCKQMTGLPVIGIKKVADSEGNICITPHFADAEALAKAGADLVALDVRHNRPLGDPLAELLPRVKKELGVVVMADCATLADARAAVSLGADVISTTFGFKRNSIGIEPDFELIEAVLELSVPVIAEGGFWCPDQVVKAFRMGVWSVVFGSAITRPLEITKRFVRAIDLGGESPVSTLPR